MTLENGRLNDTVCKQREDITKMRTQMTTGEAGLVITQLTEEV